MEDPVIKCQLVLQSISFSFLCCSQLFGITKALKSIFFFFFKFQIISVVDITVWSLCCLISLKVT